MGRNRGRGKRASVVVASGVLAVAIASFVAWSGADDDQTPDQPARLVLRDAAEGQRRGCGRRPDLTVYALGERFQREPATRLGTRCDAHASEAEVFYGPCRDGGESGCGYDISVRSRPMCQSPSEVKATFNAPPDPDVSNSRTVTNLRGVPAAVFEEHIVLVTGGATIFVFADPKIARRAVDALRPVASTAPEASLPKPTAELIDGRLRGLRCPE
jgi:hypothetical protein